MSRSFLPHGDGVVFALVRGDGVGFASVFVRRAGGVFVFSRSDGIVFKIISGADQIIRQILLLNLMHWIIVWIFVADAVAEFFCAGIMAVAQVLWHGAVFAVAHVGQSALNAM